MHSLPSLMLALILTYPEEPASSRAAQASRKHSPLSTYVGLLDVSVKGNRYRGTYMTETREGRIVKSSGIILSQWEDGPSTSLLENNDGRTFYKIGETVISLPGRPVVIASSEHEIVVLDEQIPAEVYQSLKMLEERIEALLDKKFQPVPEEVVEALNDLTEKPK